MRVVVVSAWPPWLEGHGGTLVLHHHLRELASRHDIVVLSAGAPTATAAIPAGAANVPNVDVAWFGTDRKPALDYAARRASALAQNEPAHVGYVLRPSLLARLQAELTTADLIYGFGWGTAGLHRYAGDVPVVHTAVDAWALGRTGRLLSGWRKITDLGETNAIDRHEAMHYPKLAAVTVVAETDAAYLRRIAPTARIEVITNGVAAGPPTNPPPLDPPVLGFHGNFGSEHNVDGARILATQILPLVRRELPEVRGLIAGREPGPDVRKLVGDHVELIADAPDLRPVLDRVTVGVAVMNSGTGLKNKVLETMAAGRPVVANAAGLSGLGAGDGLIPAEDAADAANVIVRLLRDPARLEAEGKSARSRVETDYTWEASAAHLERIWIDAVRRR